MEIKLGSIVKSIAGKEKDKFFLVIDIDENYAVIADGKRRPLENPKKKKIKHLEFIKQIDVDINTLNNSRLRKLVKSENI